MNNIGLYQPERKGPPPTKLIEALARAINQNQSSLDETLFALQVTMTGILQHVTLREVDAHTNLDTITRRMHDMLTKMYKSKPAR